MITSTEFEFYSYFEICSLIIGSYSRIITVGITTSNFTCDSCFILRGLNYVGSTVMEIKLDYVFVCHWEL